MSKLSKEAIVTIVAMVAASLFVIFSLFLSFNLLVYLVCFGIVAIAILKYPEVGVYLTIFCTMVFERWFTLQPIVWGDMVLKFYPLDLVIVLTAASLFLHWIPKQKFIFFDKKLGWPIVLWLVVISLNFVRSFFAGAIKQELAFSTFKNFALYFVVYLLVVNIIKNKEQFGRMINTMLLAGAALIYFIFYGLVSGHGVWTEYVPLSTPGERLLGGPHSFYLTMLVMIIVNQLAFVKRWQKKEYLYFALLFIFMVGLLASLQRHLWLGLLLGLAITLLFYQKDQRKRFVKIVAAGILLVVILTLVSFWIYSWQTTNFLTDANLTHSLKFRLFSFFTAEGKDSSAMWRLASWQEAWRTFAVHPVWGVGFGRRLNFDIGGIEYNIEMRDLHNDFVGLAVQAGVFGLGVAAYLILQLWRYFLASFKRIAAQYQGYYLSFFALAMVFLWSANFGVYFDINLLVIFFWLFIANLTVIKNLS